MDAVALARRAMVVLLRPTLAWESARDETMSDREILLTYVAPLAAIPALCGAIGGMVFGFSIGDVGLHPAPLAVTLEAFAGFVLTIAATWVAGRALAGVAGLFGGVRDPARGLWLAAYAATPLWLAGIFYLLPALQIPIVLLAALWSLWLVYRGLDALMGAPQDRLLTCFAACLIVIGAVVILRGLLVAMATGLGGPLRVLGAA